MSFSLCPACLLPSEKVIATLPCDECLSSLLIAPPICRFCLGLSCTRTECLRPWMRVEGEEGLRLFTAIISRYLSIGPGAAVLKSWKKTGSPALQQYLKAGMRSTLDAFFPDTGKPLVLLPIPQSSDRRWQLNGGSVLRLCEMIQSVRRNVALVNCLELYRIEAINQARTKGDARYTRRTEIQAVAPDEFIESFYGLPEVFTDETADILLIDDFLTSGATLRSALQAVRLGFESSGLFVGRRTRVSALVLSFRPSLFSDCPLSGRQD